MRITEGGWTWESGHDRWLHQFQIDGRPYKVRGRKGDASKDSARMKREAKIRALGGTLPPGTAVLTVATALDAYLRTAGNIAPATVRIYRAAWDQTLATLGDVPLSAVTGEDLERLMTDLARDGRRQSTLVTFRKASNPVFAWATRHGKIPANPWAKVRRTDQFRAITSEDPAYLEDPADAGRLSKFLRADLSGPHVAHLLMLHAGLRIGEALGLAWSDVDLRAGTITVRQQADYRDRAVTPRLKTRKSRRTLSDLPTVLIDALRDWRAQCPNAVLVCTPTASARRRLDQPLARRGVQESLRLACLRAGVRHVHCHGLRHTAGSMLYRVTGDLTLVANFLGHENLVLVTTLYVRSTGRDDVQARMDELIARHS